MCSFGALPLLSPSDLPIGPSHRPCDGSVVSCLHCMNDPQAEGHMASYIGRRKFLATLGGAAAVWPFAGRAQVKTSPSTIVGQRGNTIDWRGSPPILCASTWPSLLQ